MKPKKSQKSDKIDPNRPAWANDLTPKQELETHRAYRRQLKHQCGTDDVDQISKKVQRIKTISCVTCGKTVEAIAVGNNHHITENHVCEILRPERFVLRFTT